ncbi:hypothetical protein F5X96DRAFT_172121 [Biscogniauxia mediterranea]|nr:hypothetical protein F5X96DRAFT_172121 [Biscogniauxia mediterranea]
MSTSLTSDSSRVASLSGYARKMSIIPKPSISVQIDNHYRSKIYTTSSEVSGHVVVSPSHDVRFDSVQILLIGTSKTRIDAVNIPQATSHTFLKVAMPIPESSYPVPRIFEAGRTYKLPFHFVIPSQLTINACNHNVSSSSIQEAHVRLPPSLGNWEKDDFAPNMSRVTYCVKARAFRDDGEMGRETTKVMEAAQEIMVLPAIPEDAPLNIADCDQLLYTTSKTKVLKKSILSAKTGQVTVSASQSGAAMISTDGHSIAPTTARLNLEFEPSSVDSQPPKVTGVSSKITSVTYFSSSGINHYPNLKDWAESSFGRDGRGCYSSTVSIPPGRIDKVVWRQRSRAHTRRDSGYCTDTPSDSDQSSDSQRPLLSAVTDKKRNSSRGRSKGSSAPYSYTASIQVPIQLPTHKKQFLPTFHSCITSRIYVLNLTVTLLTGSASSNITVSVPLQIGVEAPSPRVDDAQPPTFEASMQEDEATAADEFLRPRTLYMPDIAFQSTLPGYGDLFAPPANRRGEVATAAN